MEYNVRLIAVKISPHSHLFGITQRNLAVWNRREGNIDTALYQTEMIKKMNHGLQHASYHQCFP